MLFLWAHNSNRQIIHSKIIHVQNATLINQLGQEIEQRGSVIKARTQQLESGNQKIQASEKRLKNITIGAEFSSWGWNCKTGHHEVNNRCLETPGLNP